MKFCSNCGTKLESNTVFCSNCGVRVEQPDGEQPVSAKTEELATAEAKTEELATAEAKTEELATAEAKTEELVKDSAKAAETQIKEDVVENTAGSPVSLSKASQVGWEGAAPSGDSQTTGYQNNTYDNQAGPVQQAEPMNTKTKKLFIILLVCIVAVVAVAVAAIKVFFFPGYETPVKNLAKAVDKQKEKYVEENVPKAYKDVKEAADMDYDELFTYSITNGDEDYAYDDIEKAEYKIVEKKKVSEKKAKAIKAQLKDSISSEKKISFDTEKCYALAVEFKLDNGDDKKTFETVIYTAKSDGKWILLLVKNVDLNDEEEE